MEKNILLIATYDSLFEMSLEIVRKYNFPVVVIRGNSEDVENIASYWLAKGMEVAITRGGTFKNMTLKNIMPVVEIKVNAFDILRAYRKVKNKNDKIGFIGWDNVIFGVDVFREVFGKSLYTINVYDNENFDNVVRQIRKLVDEGVTEFIGDNTGVRIAHSLNLPVHMVENNEDTVISSIQEAMRIVDAKNTERAYSERLKVTMDFIRDGIVAVDDDGKPVIFNKEAEKFCFDNSLARCDLVDLLELAENTVRSLSSVEIKKLRDDCVIAVNKSPVLVNDRFYGMVATFQNISQIQRQEQEIRTRLSAKGLAAKYKFDDIIFKSESMKNAVSKAKKYALSDSTVLIEGPTGSGKELFAHSIHNYSLRADGPFVAVNCAALPENLLESELFGYADGAFTGARRGGRTGLFELAHKGTIFLDEIGDMPLNLQSRLLRVIQEKEVMRIGDEKILPVDIRIISSTNVNLIDYVMSGKFREDLFYRLNILALKIPPLNSRVEDILPLAENMLRKYSEESGKYIKGFDETARNILASYNFRGNVRELGALVERAVVIAEKDYISASDFGIISTDSTEHQYSGTIKSMEMNLIEKTLHETGSNYSQAARILGIDRSTLYRKLKEYKIMW